MEYTAGLVAGHHIQIDRVNAVENAALDIGIVAAQTAQQDLDLLPLGTAAPLSHIVQFSVKRHAHWINSRLLYCFHARISSS